MDNREIIEVEPESIDKILKDFTTKAINNSDKVYLPLYLTPEVYEMEPSKRLLTLEFQKVVRYIVKMLLSGIEHLKVILLLLKMKSQNLSSF